MVIRRFDVYLVSLDHTVGKEIQKTRPCVVVSPDEMDRRIGTVIVAPTTAGRTYPTGLACTFVPRLHNEGTDTLLGRTGKWGADDSMHILGGSYEYFGSI